MNEVFFLGGTIAFFISLQSVWICMSLDAIAKAIKEQRREK